MRRLAFLTSFKNLHGTLEIRKELFDRFSSSLNEFYIINSDNLVYLPNLKKFSFFEKDVKINKNQINQSNIKLFNPKNEKEFYIFSKEKKLLIINNFGKSFFSLKIYFLLKRLKIQQVYIENLGSIGMPANFEAKNYLRYLNYHIFQKMFSKFITPFLVLLGLVPRIEIHFTSKKLELMQAKKKLIKGYLYKKKLLFAKEYKLINSRSYDINIENKYSIAEKYITHLDAEMNGRHEIETRGYLPKNVVDQHYFHLRKFLKKLSKDFGKPVVICLHPSINSRDVKKFIKSSSLKGFKIVQYKTKEYIYKSFLVTTFDTSAIVDAAILKKRIIGLWSKYMDINQIKHSKTYPSKIGFSRINFEDFKYNKSQLLNLLDNNKKKYSTFLKNYHIHKKGLKGSDAIINILKRKYKIS
tara:strand:- start:17170 stop:18405 length:1236 start_codon:yes stop_codon:yes gene_type:complete